MAFQKYIPNEQVNSPRISICGNLNINKEAARELSLADYTHAQLEYDAEIQKIAMHFFKRDIGNCLVLCKRPGGGIQMNMRGFCNRFKISSQPPRALFYKIPKPGESLILSFEDEQKPNEEKVELKTNVIKRNVTKKKEPKGEVDYECVNCSYENPAWKYNRSMQPLGHPEVCPKCYSSAFKKIILRESKII